MKIFALFFVLSFQLFSMQAIALIHGEVTPSLEVSTVKLQINHRHWLRSVNSWDEYTSRCSGVIVGKNPLTILTAAHCLREAKVDHETLLPSLTIVNQRELGIEYARLIKAFYKQFDEVEKNLALDVAVLVFDAELTDKVTFIPIQKSKVSKQALLCGYGSGYKEVELQNPRCSKKTVLTDIKDFYSIMPQEYEKADEMLYLKARAQFEYKKDIVKSLDTLMAVNRLNSAGNYSSDEPIPTSGDSGGPWIVESEKGELRLVAITSLVERFYHKTRYWPFFNIPEPLEDFPYVAYGIKLGHREVLDFLNDAIKQGADIQFSDKGFNFFGLGNQ